MYEYSNHPYACGRAKKLMVMPRVKGELVAGLNPYTAAMVNEGRIFSWTKQYKKPEPHDSL